MAWQRAIATAERQGGVLARRQLREAGLSSAAIHRCRRAGLLHDRHRATYALGRPTVTPYGAAHAAVLAANGRGAVAAASALALVGALPWPRRPRIVITGGPLLLEGVDVRRTRCLPREELVTDGAGLVACRWPRALVDLAAEAPVAALQDALDGLERCGLLDLEALRRTTDARRRPGVRKLRRALEPFLTIEEEEYRSLLERFAGEVLRGGGITGFRLNVPMRLRSGLRIVADLWFADSRLVVELDGRSTHERARRFEADRRRDRELLLEGIRTARFTWQDVRHRPRTVVRDVAALLRHPTDGGGRRRRDAPVGACNGPPFTWLLGDGRVEGRADRRAGAGVGPVDGRPMDDRRGLQPAGARPITGA